MPNIFICGYEMRAGAMKNKIDGIMQKMGLQDEAITSIVDMKAESCDGKKTIQPYLRVCSTDKAQILEIIHAFKEKGIGEDVEWLVVDGFIPADKML